jgi:hypothetical protein
MQATFSEVKVVTTTWTLDQAGEHKFIKLLVSKLAEKIGRNY